MKILLLCTAHNSLSQRLYLVLSPNHQVTVEYALSAQVIIEAVNLVEPDLIICPFLTTLVPKEVYTQYLTLIIHPGVPGDGGPSALDWVLMGDDGTNPESENILQEETWSISGRSHWGVTVLQAIEEFDAGPVWAFEQYIVDIDDQTVTKSSLYRGDVTRSAIKACLTAIERIQQLVDQSGETHSIGPHMKASPEYGIESVTTQETFQGGTAHYRPLLKASQRDFDIKRHSAQVISRRIRASDSQPGCLTTLFKPSLYIYGGVVEDGEHMATITAEPGAIIDTRSDAICVKTVDGKGIWITHARRVKKKTDPLLWPKVPAVPLFVELGILDAENLPKLLPPLPTDFSKLGYSTFQEVYVGYETISSGQRVAYLTFNFYNGAMSTKQCYQTSAAMRSILATHTESSPLCAVILLGGNYFSNGVHLNVIEAAKDSAFESWANINAINDVVLLLLQDFAAKRISTVSALRGNAAAGGVALATAADLVLAGENVVLNPAYRALGLYGSEYHSVSYYGRTGPDNAQHLLRDMLPLSTSDAKKIGLVDVILPGYGEELDSAIRKHVDTVFSLGERFGQWKDKLDLSPQSLAHSRMQELGEMGKDFWSARSVRYHSRRSDFVRKVKTSKTPLRFAQHRRKAGELDEEEDDAFDMVETFEERKRVVDRVQKKQMNVMDLLPDGKKALEPIFSCYYNA